MAKLIATIVTVVVVLGLIAGTLLKMNADTEKMGDKAVMEQKRINIALENQNSVVGLIVKQEYDVYGDTVVTVNDSGGNALDAGEISEISDKAIFTKTATYDEDGEIATIIFDQIDLN
jgi:hypothetical protein